MLVVALSMALPARASTPSNGWVVWASDRNDGRHEIYLMKSDGTGIKRLTFNGGKHPGWSPDAKWIAYNDAAEKTHVIRHTGSGDKKVCDGAFEFWMWDKSGLVCRINDDHYLVNADTGTKKLLFKKSDFSKIGSKALNPGGISADGRWLVAHSDIYRTGYTGSNGTFKAYHAAVILDFQDKSKIYFFGQGCEPSTPPTGSYVYHVCGGGVCSTFPDPYRMSLNDVSTRSSYKPEIAHADSDWGHEYFPRVSNDNKWLSYGATTGCHDHDTCDYEIFIHKLGAGSSDRTRITTHSKNDQWPHLWVGTLPSFGCTTNGECDDGDPCTSDTCSGGQCQHSAVSGCCTQSSQCDDKDPCTADSCSSNKCQHSTISGCCTQSSQCDDKDPCTTDSCSSNKCQHSTVSGCCTTDSQCDDGDVCTADSCSSNKCQHSSVSGCCTKDSQCDDGNVCTTDKCSSNKCQHSSVSGCCKTDGDCDDKNPCTTDTCDTATGACSNQKKSGCCAVDTDCDDGNVCTTDKCSSNKCQHSSVSGCCKTDGDCDDSNPCTTDTCDAKTGTCTNKSQAGCCAVDTDCDDGDPCTLDQCDPSNTCQHTNICSDSGIVPADSSVPAGDGAAAAGDTGVQPDAGPTMEDGGGSGLSPIQETRRLSGGCSMPASGPCCPPFMLLVLLGLVWARRSR
jgi:hypothetical protein